jgi:transposase
VRFRKDEDLPPAAVAINSPHDVDARFGRKRGQGWTGYKAHLTETCEEDAPHLITDVQTTPATTADSDVLPQVHQDEQARDLLPGQHVVDSGYVDAELLVESQQQYGIDLCGPPRANVQWQAQAQGGFSAGDFAIDWAARQATCPGGKTSRRWHEGMDSYQNPLLTISFSNRECGECSLRPQCTRSQSNGRSIAVRPQAQHEALMRARQREGTAAFRQEYAARAGVEGTVSQAVRRCDLRHARYVGMAKTHLQHVLTAASINFVRAAAWLRETPLARTREAAFLRLSPQAA